MRLGKDVSAHFKNLYVVHQNIPGKSATVGGYKEHLLFLPLQGQIRIDTEEKKFVLGPGQMLYLAPGVAHSFSSSSQGGERLIAMLAPRAMKTRVEIGEKVALNQLVKEVLFYLLLHPKTKNSRSLVNVFSETLAEILEQTPFSGGIDHLEGKVSDPRIRQVLMFMRESADQRISVEELAKRSGLSSRNFNRLLLKETGLQPRQWLINFRIERAQELLKRPGASVTEVALEVGYNSLSQFIEAFRSRTGQLPSDYLKRG